MQFTQNCSTHVKMQPTQKYVNQIQHQSRPSRCRPLAWHMDVINNLDAAGVILPNPTIVRSPAGPIRIGRPPGRVLGMLGPHTPGPSALGAPPSRVFPPATGDAVLRERIHLQVARGTDVKTTKTLVVGDSQRGEGFVKVDVAQVDCNVEVCTKQVADCWGGQQPIVGQDASIVANGL